MLRKCGKCYGYNFVDNHKTALKFIYRVLDENIQFKNYQNNLIIADSINSRLKDICNWLNRPAGKKYYPVALKAYFYYNSIDTTI